MTEKKCPMGYDSEPTCNENAVCRDCPFNKGGCNWEEFKEQWMKEHINGQPAMPQQV